MPVWTADELIMILHAQHLKTRAWANNNTAEPIATIPHVEHIYYKQLKVTQADARERWTWGLWVPEAAQRRCEGQVNHFRYIYGFADGTYLERVFFANRGELNLFSTNGELVRFGKTRETGWHFRFYRWAPCYENTKVRFTKKGQTIPFASIMRD